MPSAVGDLCGRDRLGSRLDSSRRAAGAKRRWHTTHEPAPPAPSAPGATLLARHAACRMRTRAPRHRRSGSGRRATPSSPSCGPSPPGGSEQARRAAHQHPEVHLSGQAGRGLWVLHERTTIHPRKLRPRGGQNPATDQNWSSHPDDRRLAPLQHKPHDSRMTIEFGMRDAQYRAQPARCTNGQTADTDPQTPPTPQKLAVFPSSR